jgi:hypothetical protein
MERKELVSKALEAGITKAHTMKSVVLEEMLAGMAKTEKTGKRGRPVNENSPRQLRLKELEAKKANGELKRGRPVDTESVRQKRIADIQTRKESGEFKLGRAINPESERQKRLKEMELKRENGLLKRGRPAKLKHTFESDELVEISAVEGGIE